MKAHSVSKSTDRVAWWAVDLNQEYEITAVALFTSSTSGRLDSRNITLRLLDGSEAETLASSYRRVSGESITSLPVSPPVTARHVQIQLKEEKGRTLDKVEVFTNKTKFLLSMLLNCSRMCF